MRHNRWLLAAIAGATLWTVGCGSDSIDTINKINAERQQLRSRYVDLQKQKEALKVRVSTLETEAQTHQSTLDEHTAAAADLQTQLKALQNQLKDKDKALTEANAAITEHQEAAKAQSEALEALKTALAETTANPIPTPTPPQAAATDGLQQKLDAQVAANATLREQLTHHSATCKETQTSLERRISELTTARDRAVRDLAAAQASPPTSPHPTDNAALLKHVQEISKQAAALQTHLLQSE